MHEVEPLPSRASPGFHDGLKCIEVVPRQAARGLDEDIGESGIRSTVPPAEKFPSAGQHVTEAHHAICRRQQPFLSRRIVRGSRNDVHGDRQAAAPALEEVDRDSADESPVDKKPPVDRNGREKRGDRRRGEECALDRAAVERFVADDGLCPWNTAYDYPAFRKAMREIATEDGPKVLFNVAEGKAIQAMYCADCSAYPEVPPPAKVRELIGKGWRVYAFVDAQGSNLSQLRELERAGRRGCTPT